MVEQAFKNFCGEKEMVNHLFVYGTLLDKFAPSEINKTIKKLKYVDDGYVFGCLYDLGEYPGAVLNNSTQTKIFGRVYQLPSDISVLQRLDEYEEFYSNNSLPNLFVRKKTIINLKNGRKIKGWIYEYNQDVKSLPIIESGDYSKIAA